MSGFAVLRAVVFDDRAAMLHLTDAATLPELFAAVTELARTRGLTVAAGELEAVAQLNRRGWLERWLD